MRHLTGIHHDSRRDESQNRHVVERFARTDGDSLLYSFTVEDPWPASENKVFEYACHEGNYALGNILRGARLLEADALAAGGGGE